MFAIDSAVYRGGAGIGSSISDSGDLPTIVEAFANCAEEVRRDDGVLEGVTPPTPCKEFKEAFRSNVGVEDRERWLMELGDRWRGLRGGNLPFGEALELSCRPNVRPGAGD